MVQIGMGLDSGSLLYYGSQYAFLDRMKASGNEWAKSTPLNAQGFPTTPEAGKDGAYTLVNVDPVALPTTDRYVLTWQGTGTFWFPGSKIVSSEPGRIIVEYTGQGSSMLMAVKDIGQTDPVHDIHLVREDQQALFAKGEIFNPDFLAKASQWSVLRFMDWGFTNNNQDVNWSDRTKVTDTSWMDGAPIEIMVKLANQAHTDMWYNIPAHASDDYVIQALTYIRDNLDSSLKLHLEYSNEVWNWGFEQAQYSLAMGKHYRWDGTYLATASDQDTIGNYGYYGYRSAQIAKLTDTVFGAQSDARVHNVLATQTYYTGLEDYFFRGIKAANVGAASDLFEEYAVTTYFGSELEGHTDADKAKVLAWARAKDGSGLDAAFQEIQKGGLLATDYSLAKLKPVLEAQAKIAAKYGLDLVAYEGGTHITANAYDASVQQEIVDFFTRLVNDPRMGTLYTQMIADFGNAGGKELTAFVDVGQGSKFGFWGALPSIYDSHSPKYDALVAAQTGNKITQVGMPATTPVVTAPVATTPVVTTPVVTTPAVTIPVVTTPTVTTPVVTTPVVTTPTVTTPVITPPVANPQAVSTSVSQVLDAASPAIILSASDPYATTAINLTGNAGNQTIIGNAGDNIINGGGGADTMIGLGGNDTYLVRGLGDIVYEDGNGGTDTIFTTVSYSLGLSEVETLSTVTHTDTDPINLVGNFRSSLFIGNYGNNMLNGGYGADTLIGLKGDDTYVVYDSGTKVVENAGEGNDLLLVGVDYTLSAGTSVESLIVQDRSSTTGFTLRGNELAQIIAGGAGADTIDGRGGADTLMGGAGADHFAFTTALGNGNAPQLSDFAPGVDRISLSTAIFTALPGGAGGMLSAENFALGKAADANDFIVYDQATGHLFYDADGNGAGAAVLFAQLPAGVGLTARDIELVAPPVIGG